MMYLDLAETFENFRKALFKINLTDAKYIPKRSQRIKNKIRRKRRK